MSDVQLVDITLHFDPKINASRRADIEAALRAIDGVVSVHFGETTPHLAVVEYNPERTNGDEILACAEKNDGHVEMVGL